MASSCLAYRATVCIDFRGRPQMMITTHHLPSVGSRGHHGYLLIHTIQSAYGVASCWNRCLLNSFCGTGVTSPQRSRPQGWTLIYFYPLRQIICRMGKGPLTSSFEAQSYHTRQELVDVARHDVQFLWSNSRRVADRNVVYEAVEEQRHRIFRI